MNQTVSVLSGGNQQDIMLDFLALSRSSAIWQNNAETSLSVLFGKTCELLGLACISIWSCDEYEQNLFCTKRFGQDGELSKFPSITLSEHPAFSSKLTEELVSQYQPFPNDSSEYNPLIGDKNLASIVAPLHTQESVSGALVLSHASPNHIWSENETHICIALIGIIDRILIFDDLNESERLYRNLFDSLGDATFIIAENYFKDCNPAALKMFGCKYHELVGQTPYKFSPIRQPDGRLSSEKAMEKITAAFAGKTQFFEWQHRRLDGALFTAEVTLNSVTINHTPHLIASVRDVTERNQKDDDLRKLHAMQQAILDGANYGIISTDLDGVIQTFNCAAEKMLGYTKEHVIGTYTPAIFHDQLELKDRIAEICDELGEYIEPSFRAFVERVRLGYSDEKEWTFVTLNGDRFPGLLSTTALKTASGEITGLLCVLSDITEKRRAKEDLLRSKLELEYRANHDSLTGLPNRSKLHESTATAIRMANIQNHKCALLLLDLDRFKEVNDTLGHYAGDLLLQRLSHRLKETLVEYHSQLFRLGGDEFAILSPAIDSLKDAIDIGNIINRTLHQPIELDGATIELGGSIGIACYPDHGKSSESLLRCADVAMYRAKSTTEFTITYDPSLDTHTPRRLAIMTDLGKAIREDQLLLYFQPRISLETGKCESCEALIRWRHPSFGLIEPEEFIPLAEMSDVIHPLSMWVLRQALHAIKMWEAKGHSIGVSINISARNLLDMRYPEYLRQLMEEYQIDKSQLEIEITESAFISDPERSLKVINRIHELGVSMTIDDFGTGYSSLSYLKRLPLDFLKIDRSFIQDLTLDNQDAVIVKSTIDLAHSFGLKVVAEGVEDEKTYAALRQHGCEYGQGYHFKYPQPLNDFIQWLNNPEFEGGSN